MYTMNEWAQVGASMGDYGITENKPLRMGMFLWSGHSFIRIRTTLDKQILIQFLSIEFLQIRVTRLCALQLYLLIVYLFLCHRVKQNKKQYIPGIYVNNLIKCGMELLIHMDK